MQKRYKIIFEYIDEENEEVKNETYHNFIEEALAYINQIIEQVPITAKIRIKLIKIEENKIMVINYNKKGV